MQEPTKPTSKHPRSFARGMIEGHWPWEVEIAFFTEKRGIDPEKARIFTVLRWMYHGDFRPLAWSINEGHALDEAIGNSLSRMIGEGRLKLVARKGRRRYKVPATFGRNIVAALAYEAHTGKSDEAFAEIANDIGISEQTVRQAVTAWRKAERKLNNK
jgi:hypothetical protein